MLAFVDQSGIPHPKDQTEKSALAAVCIKESSVREITRQVYSLKKSLLNNESFELKAKSLLRPKTFRNIPEKKELVESILEFLRQSEILVFAIIMEKPDFVPHEEPGYLPKQIQYLLRRINYAAVEMNSNAIVIFDQQDPHTDAQISLSFNNYLYRSNPGRALQNILEVPLFVSSYITVGIQFADLCAGIIRQYYEEKYEDKFYRRCIKRYHDILRGKTRDYQNPNGTVDYGFYHMPAEKFHTGPEDKENMREIITEE